MKQNYEPETQRRKSGQGVYKVGGKTVDRRRSPRFTGTELRQRLTSFDRAPFTDLLAEWVELCPTREAVTALAETDPAKFIHALQSISKMAGFSERTETSVEVTHNYRTLSDSQIEDKLKQLADRLGLPATKFLTIDATTLEESKDA